MATQNGAFTAAVTAGASFAGITKKGGFPSHALLAKVELLLNTTWTDITKYVLVRDDIIISPFGRTDESSSMDTSSMTLTLKNTDGRFTPDNASGAYFPYVQLNTQIRVSVNDVSATGVGYSGYRFFGEVSEWPPQWDVTGRDVYCQITASGIWRRLSQRTKTMGSPYTRYNNTLNASYNLVGYWPMEDGQGSNYFATTTGSTAANMTISGPPTNVPTLASVGLWPGSDALPTLNAAEFDASISTSLHPTTNQFRFTVWVPYDGDTGRGLSGGTIARMHTNGTVATVDIGYGSPVAGGPLTIKGYNSSSSLLFSSSSTLNTYGNPMLVLVSLAQVGSNITWAMNTILPGGTGWYTTTTGSISSASVDDVYSIIFNPGGTYSGISVGQASVFYGNPPFASTSQALNAWTGENAGSRFSRICTEEGIPHAVLGTTTTQMGPQIDDTISNVLQDIENTDGGLLYETQNTFGLGYRTMASMQNQAVALTLDYAQQQVGQPLAPVNDDALVRNDITLTNYDGYSVRVYLANGARSLQPPPNGVGTGYEYALNVNGYSHTQVNNRGIQLLNMGTVATSRYPTITANLARTTTAPLFNAVPTMRQGDYLQIANMPAFGGPATQKQLVWGWTETINNFAWTFAFNAIPEAPWESSFNPGTSVSQQVPASPTTQSTGAGGTGTVTSAQIAEGAIIGQNLAGGAVQGGNIATGTITATNIADATITGTQIAAGGIGAANIANASITATQIANGTITATQISSSANITGSQIANATITGTNISGSANITGSQIASATIQGSNLATGTITATNIQNASITNVQLSPTAGITAGQVAFTAADIGGVAMTFQGTAPTSPSVGDLWIDTSNGNRLNEYATLTVSTVGTPSAPALTTSGTGTVVVTGSWSGTQLRTANNLLVAIVTAWGSTSAGATAENTGTTGWTKQYEDTTEAQAKIAIWTNTAAGSDAAPAFTSSISGTSAQTRLECLLFELTTGSSSTLITPGVSTGGTAHGTTVASLTPTAAANTPSTGCLAIAAAVEGYTSAGTFTFTRTTGWTNVVNDGSTSTYSHASYDTLGNPPTGSAASDAIGWGSSTITAACAAIAVFSPGIGWQPYKYGTNALADQAVTQNLIAPQAVGTGQIANNAITAAQIANATITNSQISSTAGITGGQIASGTITASNIGTGQITSSQISASANITGSQIAGGTITASNIGSLTITNAQIANGTITNSQISGTAGITGAQLANATITNVQISNGTITTTQISNSANITGTQIANNTITTGNIAANTITASNIAAGVITSTQIAANTIIAGNIATGAITSAKILAGTVVSGIVDATTITGANLVADGSAGQILIYSGTPANGNLVGSWSGASGSDSYGNSFSAGLTVGQGVITGLDIDSVTITNATLQGDILNGSTLANPAINGGTILEPAIQFDSNGGQLLSYTSSTTPVTLSAGSNSWTVPAGVYSLKVECWGAGGGGSGGTTSLGGAGGGGGQYSSHDHYAVTPGQVITYQVGQAGSGGSTNDGGNATDGGDTYFDGSGGIFAAGGDSGDNGGAGGSGTTGSGNVFHTGGNGGGVGSTGGASGGNSANSSPTNGTGNSGTASTSSTHAGAPAGQTGSGGGGAGGDSGSSASSGGTPGGGGGGAGKGSATGSKTVGYTPVWTGSYYGPDSTITANGLRSSSVMYQGGETASGGGVNGNQYSIFGFNRTQIASDFSGYTITSCLLQLENVHTYYSSGMTIIFDEYQGLPGTLPSTGPRGDYSDSPANATTGEGEEHVYTLAASVGQRFVTGSTNGLGFGWDTYNNPSYRFDTNFYGYFETSQIRLNLTGTTGATGSYNGGNGGSGQIIVTYTSSTVLGAAIAPASGNDGPGGTGGNAFAAGYTGPVSVFHPGSSPTAVETWTTMTSLANSWGINGLARYKLVGYNMMLLQLNINDGSATSGTFMTMPSGYSATAGQFPTLVIYTGSGGSVLCSSTIVQVGTGSGANLTILNWTKQSKQYVGNLYIALD